MDLDPPLSQYVRQIQHWDTPRPLILIFNVANTDKIYAVNVDDLAKYCHFFDSMRSLPRTKGMDGTEENPILLPPGVTEKGFEGFLRWCRHLPWEGESWGPPKDENSLRQLLLLGDMWISKPLLLFAMERLKMMHLSPCKMLGIAVHFRIRGWLDCEVKRVLLIPHGRLTEHDYDDLRVPTHGDWIIYSITKAREALIAERALVATHPLIIPFSSPDRPACPDNKHKECIRATQEAWVRHIAPNLLDRFSPLNLFDVTACDIFLRSKAEAFRGVNKDCFEEIDYQYMRTDWP
ncbi:hypothetical protein BKA70DRAFT_1446755 [Coprinopsis sp. MPI-PUGE-AT-0042]|nr:hypothetical protein BKA70DRAFT_1446755 [Coprinopsis sp. MPI-PUGE-AT-0042]